MDPKLTTQTMITSVQAAERFGITNDYVSQLCRAGKVDGVRLERVWHVHEEGLKQYLAEMQAKRVVKRQELSRQLRGEYVSNTATASALAEAAVEVVPNSITAPAPVKTYNELTAFAKAPSYFWVKPDTRVVLKGVALGSFLIFSTLGLTQIWSTAAINHTPLVTLQTEYEPAHAAGDVLTSTLGAATVAFAVPEYSNAFSPIVPMGPMLAMPAVSEQDVRFYTEAFAGSLKDTVASAWQDSAGAVASAFVKSTNDLAVASNNTVSNEFNTASVWDAWTNWLGGVLYPAKSGPAYAVVPNITPTQLIAIAQSKVALQKSPVQPVSQTPSTEYGVGMSAQQIAPTLAPLANLSSYVTQDSLATQLNQFANSLKQLIYVNAGTVGVGQYSSGGYINNIALATRIDQLPGTATINGSQILTAADLPTLPQLTGTPTYGQLLLGNSKGAFDLVSTSSLGIVSGSNYTFSYPLTNAGNTISLAFGTTTSNTWSGAQIFNGNVGVGTTSPGWNLSVVGTTTSSSLYIPGTSSASGMLTFAGVNGSSVFNQEITQQVSGNNSTLLFNLNHGSLPGSNENNTIRFNGPNTSLEAVNANDSLGLKAAESFNTGFLGLISTGGSSGSVPGGGFLLSFALSNSGKVGSIVPTSSYGSPSWRNVLDDGSGNMTITGNVGIGSSTPGTLLSLGNTGGINFALGTSTFSTTGGINLAAGCFAVSGVCITGGGASLTGSIGQLAYFSGANTALGTSSLFISTVGNVGIGTTSPYAKLTVYGGGTGNLFELASSAGSASTTILQVSSAGVLSIGDSTSGVPSGIFSVDASSSTTTISNLSLGNLTFDADAGMVQLSDIPVDANASLGTIESQSISVGGNPLITAYGVANGSGSVTNLGVAIGTSSPSSMLTVWGADTAAGTQVFLVANSASTTLLSINDSGLTTLSNLLATASSTLQNFTGINATTTNATSTSLFATTASSTNLFATLAKFASATIGALTLNTPLAISSGGTGTSTAPTANKLLLADANGAWEYVATSSLGISGGSSQWTTSGSGIYFNTGLVGIGASGPSATLTVSQTNANTAPLSVYNYQKGGGFTVITLTYTASTTWTKPANLDHIVVQVYGGGGGGGGLNGGPDIGATGGTSFVTFNTGVSKVQATGGAGGSGYGTGGTGGSGSGGDTNTSGTSGGVLNGGAGAGSGAGSGGAGAVVGGPSSGGSAPGGGGGGLSTGFSSGGGGGGGGYSTKTITAASLGATEAVGVGGGGGGNSETAGTGGSGNSAGAGSGGSGANSTTAGLGSAPSANSTTGGTGGTGASSGGSGGTAGNAGTNGSSDSSSGNGGSGGGGGGAGTQGSLSADGVNYTYNAGGAGGNGGACTGSCSDSGAGGGGGGGAAGGNGGDASGTSAKFGAGAGGAGGEVIITEYITNNTLISSSPTLTVSSGGNVGVGTSSPYANLSVWGGTSGDIASFISSASTTLFNVTANGFGTTTVAGLNISGQATSTSNVGFNITSGCYALNGTCLSAGGGGISLSIVNAWSALQNFLGNASSTQFSATQAWFGGTATSTFTSAGFLGIGTSTPYANLSVHALNGSANTTLFAIASSTQTATTTLFSISNTGALAVNGSNFVVTSAGNVGIATSSPYALLTVGGGNKPSAISTLFAIASSTGVATTTYMTVDANGFLSIGTGAGLSNNTTIAPGESINTGNNGIFTIDASSGTTTISNLSVGNLTFDTDAGIVNLSDIPVDAIPSAGVIESQSMAIGGTQVLTVYGENDGAGSVQNLRVGIGTSSPETTLTVVGAICAARVAGTETAACGTTAGEIFANSSALTQGVDVAEMYPTNDASVAAGDIVSFDPAYPEFVQRASGQGNFLGVVSTNPALTLGELSTSSRAIALAGRVPVKVNLDGGPISVGDGITLSSVPGVGARATSTSQTVGIALGSYDGTGTSSITVFIKPELTFAGSDLAAIAGLANLASTTQQTSNSFVASFLQGLFAQLTTWLASAGNGIHDLFANTTHQQTLCVGTSGNETCITKAQLDALLANVGSSGNGSSGSSNNSGGSGNSGNASSTPPSTGSGQATVPPTITINGDNPATISVGSTYADLGATVSDTGVGQAGDTNLGTLTFVNGALVQNISLDTSTTTTYSIDYVATDNVGLTATSTRVVNVQ